MNSRQPIRTAVLLPDGVVPGDLTTPLEILGRARSGERPLYDVHVCGDRPVDCGWFTITPRVALDFARTADLVVVPGVHDPSAPVSAEILATLRAAHGHGARIASICTGAFLLAATGLLDGRPATTHWAAAPLFARRFPEVALDPDVLFVDDGEVLTSAGAAAGLDLCLHLVARDGGAEVAAHTARMAVLPLHRSGGQAQFIERPTPPAPATLGPLLSWIDAHPQVRHTVASLARREGTSTRSLTRRFLDQTGLPPARWVRQSRLRAACRLLETTDWSIERVAEAAGYGSVVTLRQHVGRELHTTPTAYRRTFGHSSG